MEERGIATQKRFGQNFLVQPDARKRLLDALGAADGDAIWEVGPGLGAMTSGLLARGATVTAFEIDAGFCAVLSELFADADRFSLVRGDCLKTWQGVSDGANTPPRFLLGNLPYNIAQTLLGDFMENGRFFSRVVVTVQKEVAARFLAASQTRPKSADYAPISVLTSFYYEVRSVAVLKGASFYPVPRIDSQALLFTRKNEAAPLPTALPALVRALFARRRKTIANNLAAFLAARPASGPRPPDAATLLARAGLAPTLRAEQLAPADFVRLAQLLP
jgi:16S rRNA (adenine1518-N6/adenine1519-N6)-dimethyltransferase